MTIDLCEFISHTRITTFVLIYLGKAQITDDNVEANARKRRRAEREGRRLETCDCSFQFLDSEDNSLDWR